MRAALNRCAQALPPITASGSGPRRMSGRNEAGEQSPAKNAGARCLFDAAEAFDGKRRLLRRDRY